MLAQTLEANLTNWLTDSVTDKLAHTLTNTLTEDLGMYLSETISEAAIPRLFTDLASILKETIPCVFSLI